MPATTTRDHTVGDLLREWRGRRRMSQLELSSRASVSTRHLSFVENGRSAPTRRMVATLADHLDVPLRVKNQLFLAAGFAPPHDERDLDSRDLAPVLDGLRRLLDAHLPWPALLLDDHWDVVDSNAAVAALLAGCAPELLEPPVNAIRVTLHPGGLAPRIRNLAEWGGHLVGQLRHRAEETRDPRLGALLIEAESWLGAVRPGAASTGPVLTMEVDQGDHVLRLFSVSARLEMANDLTVDGLHLETFVPADAATAERFSS
ncbi:MULTISPECIES: helix-turn-helix domain-containing protein [unclassified Nocardioides]|uniref:helix-turn-helix domain-containing protein n=1 Tax=unclassified Nocardioides TaxID=2615069 RepID=UPI00361B09E5